MMNNLVAYHQSIGADKDLPTGKRSLYGYLNRFHLQLAVKNPHWPSDLPFGFVYGAFINAVMYGKTELKGYNIKANVKAFRQWITQNGVEEQLYKAYYNSNPDKMPKQLKGREVEETEEDIQAKAEGYVNFPPSTVKGQIESLESIYGTAKEVIMAFPGAESYAKRLYNTREKMKKERNWV